MTRFYRLDFCNISSQMFTQKMWVLFALHLCRSSVVLVESRSSQNVLKGLHCLTSENSVNKARLVTYTIS
jgi:hypothetical protein